MTSAVFVSSETVQSRLQFDVQLWDVELLSVCRTLIIVLGNMKCVHQHKGLRPLVQHTSHLPDLCTSSVTLVFISPLITFREELDFELENRFELDFANKEYSIFSVALQQHHTSAPYIKNKKCPVCALTFDTLP